MADQKINAAYEDASGNIIETVTTGSTTGAGEVIEIKQNVPAVTIGTFDGAAAGGNPSGALFTDSAGDIFGVTSTGGQNGTGTVFELKPNADSGYGFETVASFGASNKYMAVDSSGDIFLRSKSGLILTENTFDADNGYTPEILNSTAPGVSASASIASISTNASAPVEGIGHSIQITVTLTDAPLFGTPTTLVLNNKGTATYNAEASNKLDSSGNTLVFDYTVGTNDATVSQLSVASVNLDNGQPLLPDNVTETNMPGINTDHDNTKPTVTFDAPANNGLTNQLTQTVTGTVTATPDQALIGSTVTIYDGDTSIGTGTVGANGGWSADVTLLSGDGPHTLTAKDTDAANNLGTSSAVTYNLATQAPTIGTTGLSVSGPTNAASETITVNATAEAVGSNAIAGVEVFNGTTDLGAAQNVNGVWTLTTGLTDGTVNDYSAVVTDAAGNSISTGSLGEADVATQAPTIGTTGLSVSGPTNAASETITVNATAEAVGSNAIAGVEVFNGTTDLGAAQNVNGVWTLTTGLTDGTVNDYSAVVTDAAGNSISTGSLGEADVATQAPTIGTTGLSVSGPTNAASETITVNATAEAVGSNAIAGVEVFNGTTDLGAAQNVNGVWTLTTGLTDGTVNDYSAVVTDAAGNSISTGSLGEADVATQAPTIGTTGLSVSGPTNAASETITVNATAEAVGSNAIAGVEVFNGTTDLGAAQNVNGVWTLTTGLTDGTVNDYSAVVTDAAGNSISTGSLGEADVATQAPTIGTTGLSVSGPTNAASETITVNATAEAVGSNAIAGVEVFNGTTDLGAAQNVNGVWTLTTGLTDGTVNDYSAVVTDAAGNSISTGSLGEADVATQAPTIGTTGLSVSGPTNAASETITVNATAEAVGSNAIAGVEVFNGTTDLGAAQNVNGVWTLTTGLTDGTVNDYSAVVTDAAGNSISTGSLGEADVATQAPTIGTTGLSVSGPTNAASETITVNATAEAVGSNAIAGVEVFNGTTDLGAAQNVNGVWTLTTGLTDGTVNDYSAVVTDAAGNSISTGSLGEADVATQAPTIGTTGLSVSGPTNAASETITVNATAEAVGSNAIAGVEVFNGTTDLGAAQNVNGVWTLTTGLTDGTVNDYSAVVTDAAGNSISTGSLGEADVATQAPTIGTTGLSVSGPTNAASETITVNATAEAVGSNAIAGVEVFNGTTDLGAAQNVNGVWTLTTGLTDGTVNDYSAVVTDAAGNSISTGSLGEADVATQAPTIGTTGLSVSGPTNAASETITVNATAEAVGSNAIAGVEVFNGTTDLGAAQNVNGVWTLTTGLTDGTVNDYSAVVTDAAGNSISTGSLGEADVATQAPTIGTTGLSVSGPTNAASETITVNATAEAVGSNAIAGVEVFNGTTDLGAAQNVNGVWTLTTGLTDGTVNDYSAVVTDAAGNSISTGSLGSVVVDRTPPTVLSLTDTTSNGKAILNASQTVTFTLTGSEDLVFGSDAKLKLTNGALADYVSGGNFVYAVQPGDTMPDLLVDGYQGSITDRAGNALVQAGVVKDTHIIIDTTPATNSVTESISVGANGATVTVSDVATDTNGVASVKVNGNAAKQSGDTWSYTDKKGAQSYFVVATDNAGNSSSVYGSAVAYAGQSLTVTGTTGGDTITTNPGGMTLSVTDSTGGSNTVTAGGGANSVTISDITGGNNVTAKAGGNRVTITEVMGGSNSVTANGGGSAVTISDSGGNDSVTAAGGSNTIRIGNGVGGGSDTVTAKGGASTVTIVREGGNNQVTVDNGGNTVNISAQGGSNTVIANGGNNSVTIFDSTGGDHITFGGNNNTLTLQGRGSGDTIDFASGHNDKLVLSSTAPTAADTITGFVVSVANHDTIDLSALGITNFDSNVKNGLDAHSVGVNVINGQSLVYINTGASPTQSFSASSDVLSVNGSLTSSDFALAPATPTVLNTALKR